MKKKTAHKVTPRKVKNSTGKKQQQQKRTDVEAQFYSLNPGVQSEIKEVMMLNGLTEAIFGDAGTFNSQLSQSDTLFKNLRWYFVSNLRQLLSEVYVEIGLIQTVVDVPVNDALRGGIEIHTKQLSEEEIQELITEMEMEGDLSKYAQAQKWNRLFGGSGVIVMTDQDPSTELDMDAIDEDTPLEFKAVDMWELFWTRQNTENHDAVVKTDQLNPEDEMFDYYGLKVHKSRVIIMKGIEAPSFVRPRLRGWGLSVVESLVRSVNQYLKATDLTFEVLDEFKLDIFKIKGLSQALLNPSGEAKIRQRTALANKQKNYQNAITMDADDDYVQKQLSFAGLAEAMEGIRMQVASDLRMPLTKVFGISAAGFSSGEDDIENYNAMVESSIRTPAKFDIIKMVQLRAQKKFGVFLDDLTITFKPLRVLSAEQEENVKTQKFNRLLQARQAGEITSKEFKEGCNKDKLLPIQLDTSLDTLDVPGNKSKQDEDESTPPANVSTKATSKTTTPQAKEAAV